MTFERLHGDIFYILDALAQKLFRCRRNGNIVALHLDLRHAVHFHRHAFARVNFRRLHVNRQQFEREHIHLFKDWPDEAATALDNPKANFAHRAVRFDHLAFDAGDHEHLVRTALRVTARVDDDENKNDEQHGTGADDYCWPGNVSENWSHVHMQVKG